MRRAVTLLLAGALVLPACAGGKDPGAGPDTTGVAATATTLPTELGVGRRSIELVDTTRPTAADPARGLEELPQRTLPVLLLYPAAGPPATVAEDDAAAADGRFPLIVYSHGLGSDGPAAEPLLRELARAGYVVAAPTYPLSSGPGGQIVDYANQPADISFVLDQLLSLADDDPLAGHIDPKRAVAAGHSLGAMTTLGVGLTSCCSDPRLDAIVSLSGIRATFPGSDVDEIDRLPFLAVHGALDSTIPVDGSDALFAEAPGPAAYLRLEDGDHASYLWNDRDLLIGTVLAFLDQHLDGDEDALDPIPALVEARGNATFEVKPGP